MARSERDAVPEAQRVLVAHARASHVVVLSVPPGSEGRIRGLCAQLPALVRAVGSRDPESGLTCVVGFSADAWCRIFEQPAPAGLQALQPVHGTTQTAPATPGDVLLHVRAAHRDLCFELVTQLTAAVRGAVRVDLEVQGFRCLDNRNLLGFVDDCDIVGTAAAEAVTIDAEDPQHAGGSFVLVQTYFHDLHAWNQLHVCEQERVMGRVKVSNVPLRPEAGGASTWEPSPLFNADDGLPIVRCNMAFGSPGLDEFGTVFVAYAASPVVLQTALERLFVGVPRGSYHPVLEFSTAVSGGLFYVPAASLIRSLVGREVDVERRAAHLRCVSQPMGR